MNLSARWVYWSAVILFVVPLCLGVASWLAPGEIDTDQGDGVASVGVDDVPPQVSVDSFAGKARGTAPFRLDGRPSGVLYDPTRSEGPVQEYMPPKPVLTLNGVLDGPAPLVLIEGIPGNDGPTVLGVGDTLRGFRVRRIKDGQVTVTGMDTTWILGIKQQ